MKKLLLVGLLFCGSLITVNAQCTAAKAACCAAKKSASVDAATQTGSLVTEVSVSGPNVQMDAAEELASQDPSIQKRQDDGTGAMTYYQKSTNAKGKVSWNEVKYCNDAKKFTSLASSDTKEDIKSDKKAECGDKKQGAACCASKKAEGTK
jgi:hypothetical protein